MFGLFKKKKKIAFKNQDQDDDNWLKQCEIINKLNDISDNGTAKSVKTTCMSNRGDQRKSISFNIFQSDEERSIVGGLLDELMLLRNLDLVCVDFSYSENNDEEGISLDDIDLKDEDEDDSALVCLTDYVNMDSKETHVFARVSEDLVKARSFDEAPKFGTDQDLSLTGTKDWSPLMLMAYGYAMRIASGSLYIQGIYSKKDYFSSKTIFTGLQLKTDGSVEFQEKAGGEAIKFISKYVDNFDIRLVQTIIGIAEISEIPPDEYVDDVEFLRRMKEVCNNSITVH